MKIDDNLSQVFDMEPVKQGDVITAAGQVVLPETNSQEETADLDFDRARNNLYVLLQQGQDALIHAIEVAKSSEHPRAFEVAGGLMKQLADINEQLLKLSERKQKIDGGKEPSKEDPKTVTNNAIFVGSTSELNKLIKDMSIGDNNGTTIK